MYLLCLLILYKYLQLNFVVLCRNRIRIWSPFYWKPWKNWRKRLQMHHLLNRVDKAGVQHLNNMSSGSAAVCCPAYYVRRAHCLADRLSWYVSLERNMHILNDSHILICDIFRFGILYTILEREDGVAENFTDLEGNSLIFVFIY